MVTEVINIRVYNATGGIESSLSPYIEIFDNSDNSLDFSGTMTWNSTLKQYQFSPSIDETKTYTANVDFGSWAITRYASFGVAYSWASSGLTTIQAQQLADTVKANDVILNLGDISIPLW